MSFDPPKSRTEAILQNMLGANNTLETPKSRVEELLIQLLEQGGTGGGVTPEQLVAAIATYFERHPISKELPDKTSASTGDFLRLDGQKNAVWETISSAESNSFGGSA